MSAELFTERLPGAVPAASDLSDLEWLFGDPRVGGTLGGVKSRKEVAALLDEWIQLWRERAFGRWVFRRRADASFVGYAGLASACASVGKVELLYGLVPECWGAGLATEMANRCVAYAFRSTELTQLDCYTLATNTASRRVMEKVGFRYERDAIPSGTLFRDDDPQGVRPRR